MAIRLRTRSAPGEAAPASPAAEGSAAGPPKYARTIYLCDEDLDRLLYEKRRLERAMNARGRRRGVTDLSAIIRRLIRERLDLPPGWVPRQ